MVSQNNVEDLSKKTLFVDFGHLRAYQDAQRSLDLSGNIDAASSQNTNVILTLCRPAVAKQTVKIDVKGSASGELLWEEAILKGHDEEITLIILAYWDEKDSADNPVQSAFGSASKTETVSQKPLIDPLSGLAPLAPIWDESRTFSGHKCATCNKSFMYDENLSKWDSCSCRWYQKLFNKYYREIRSGYKDIPSFLKEVWELIIGKESTGKPK